MSLSRAVFLGHLNHKTPSGFSKHSIWNFSVFTRTVWPSGRARKLSLFIFRSSLSLCWLFHKPCFPSWALSVLTHTLHLITRTSACAFYTYIKRQSKPKRDEKLERDWVSIDTFIHQQSVFGAVMWLQSQHEIKITPISFINLYIYKSHL